MMRAAVLALVAFSAAAVEMNPIPDFRDRDKQLHALAGAGVVLIVHPVNRWVVRSLMPDATRRDQQVARFLLDSAAATAVGFGKEFLYDARREGHTVDIADAVATGLGGAGFSLVLNIAIP